MSIIYKLRYGISLLRHPQRLKSYYIHRYGSHKQIASLHYLNTYHRRVNWAQPEDLNQWILKLEFYGDTSMWSTFADKYRMREYVESLGLGQYLVPLLGVWESPDEVDFDSLPNQFVLKMNNGCGDVYIVRDKSAENLDDIRGYFRKMFSRDFSRVNGEPHYAKIRPLILAEELLDCKKQTVQSFSLVDYKFWCFGGRPTSCFVVTNRTKQHFEIGLYQWQSQWANISEGNLKYDKEHLKQPMEIPCPKNLSTMLDIAKKISLGHPEMRVDFYEIDSHVYLGEITVTSAAGVMSYFTDSYLKKLGHFCEKAYQYNLQ